MKERILELLKEGNYSLAAEELSQLNARFAASILEELDDATLIHICKELESDFLADVLIELEPDTKQKIIDSLNTEELDEFLDEVDAEDKVDIIEDLPEKTALKIVDYEEINLLLKEKNFTTLKPLLASMNENDLADIFENTPPEDMPILFRLLPKDAAAEAFVEMDSDTQEELLNRLTDQELKEVTDEMFVDDMADIVEEMPSNVVKRLLAKIDPDKRKYLNQILKYPEDSAGSIMTVEYMYFYPDITVEHAFEKIRKNAINKETIYTCYVVDRTNKLIGLVSAKDLMLASPDTLIGDIMEENVIYAHTTDDQEDVSRKLAEYGFLAIPVVDDENRLVGIVTVDDAIDVLQEENTEDIAKMNAIRPSDKPYLKTSVFGIWKNRIPWLLVLLVSATFTGLIINKYEAKLSAISAVLFACVPMIMDTGGNAGSQASVTVIRSLALGEVETKDVFRVLWKEIRVSMLLGATLAVACFGKLMLLDNLAFGYHDYTPMRCAIVSLALFITVVIAKMVGCLLPLLAKKCKLDPAVVASPFITTIVDALSLIIYCSIAVALLS